MEHTAGAPMKQADVATTSHAPVAASKAKASKAVALGPDGKPITAITPEKGTFHWYTPFAIADSIISGTVWNFGNGLSKGAKLGLKLGALAGVVMFAAPAIPVLSTLGLPTILPGLYAFADIAILALAGAAAGTVLGGIRGLLIGGVKGLEYRQKKITYADELAERNQMRAKQQTQARSANNWRDYAEAYNDYDEARQYRWFTLQHETPPGQQANWTDRVEGERHYQGHRGR